LTYSNGKPYYIGGLLHDKFEGKGTRYYRNGDTFSTTYIQGVANGEGVYHNRLRGWTSTCGYVNNIKTDVETIVYKKKKVYINWEGGNKTGIHKELYNNGDIFVRNYKDGELDENDKGIYRCKDGCVYRGKKSKKTSSMWKMVGNCWSCVGSTIPDVDDTDCIGSCIGGCIGPFVITAWAIEAAVATTVTAIAVVSTPITGIIDASSRRTNIQK
jgi:hypothetical protein